jgi:hypothetical protein
MNPRQTEVTGGEVPNGKYNLLRTKYPVPVPYYLPVHTDEEKKRKKAEKTDNASLLIAKNQDSESRVTITQRDCSNSRIKRSAASSDVPRGL